MSFIQFLYEDYDEQNGTCSAFIAEFPGNPSPDCVICKPEYECNQTALFKPD